MSLGRTCLVCWVWGNPYPVFRTRNDVTLCMSVELVARREFLELSWRLLTFLIDTRNQEEMGFPPLIGVGHVFQASKGYPLLVGVVEILYEDVALRGLTSIIRRVQ